MENTNTEKNNNSNNPNALQATMTFLNRQQLDYLDKVGKDSYFKFGHKIPRTKILFEAVQLLINLNISLDKLNLKTETLSAGILRVINNGENTNA